jgi:hypothetical protein
MIAFYALPILMLALAVLWIIQFVFLMSLQDAILPGRHDKILWVVAFLVCPFLTPLAFLLWRKVKLGEKSTR